MLPILCLSLFGCCGIASSINYTKGTESLVNEDYAQAIYYLKKAVDLNPDMARNHNNLAYAYTHVGEYDKAWWHARQAVLIDPYHVESLHNFESLWVKLSIENGIDIGSAFSEIIKVLGTPDIEIEGVQKDGTVHRVLMYGTLSLKIENEKLSSIKFQK